MARKKQDRSRAQTRVAYHRYRGDGVSDHQGRDRCRECGLAESHSVHDPVEPAYPQVTGWERQVEDREWRED